MTTPTTYLLIIALLGTACSGNSSEQAATSGRPPDSLKSEQVEANQQETVGDIVKEYIAIKDALVASNETQAQDGAVALLGIVDATQMPVLQQKVKEMAATTDLAAQRTLFDSLSVVLYEQLKQQSGDTQTLYKQYCPMAFNNRGAFWLSSNREIKNPYFGDEMLTCGRVEEEVSF